MRGTVLSSLQILAAIVMATLLGACAPAPVTAELQEADIRYELVEWARLAQNAHNVQPWRVILDPDDPTRMWLYVEDSRLLPQTDPPARQITISMGTFLAVLEARAADLGYQTDIILFPEGEYDLSTIGELPVAEITVRSGGSPVAEYPVAAAPDAITAATVKYRYRPAELAAETLAALESYSNDTLELAVITDPADVAWLNELSIEAFALEMAVERTLMESYDLTRMNGRQRRRTPYGISLTPNFPVRTLWFIDAFQTLFPQKPEPFGRLGVKLFTDAMDSVTHYVLITTKTNSRTTQVRTGMALQAVWMELHGRDHVALPNSQALQEYPEMTELYQRMHRRWAAEGDTVQMLLAVAQPKGGRYKFGPRLPTEALITLGNN